MGAEVADVLPWLELADQCHLAALHETCLQQLAHRLAAAGPFWTDQVRLTSGANSWWAVPKYGSSPATRDVSASAVAAITAAMGSTIDGLLPCRSASSSCWPTAAASPWRLWPAPLPPRCTLAACSQKGGFDVRPGPVGGFTWVLQHFSKRTGRVCSPWVKARADMGGLGVGAGCALLRLFDLPSSLLASAVPLCCCPSHHCRPSCCAGGRPGVAPQVVAAWRRRSRRGPFVWCAKCGRARVLHRAKTGRLGQRQQWTLSLCECVYVSCVKIQEAWPLRHSPP